MTPATVLWGWNDDEYTNPIPHPIHIPKYTKVKVPSTQDKQHISWAAEQLSSWAELCCYCHCLIKTLGTASLLEYVATYSHQTDYLPLRTRHECRCGWIQDFGHGSCGGQAHKQDVWSECTWAWQILRVSSGQNLGQFTSEQSWLVTVSSLGNLMPRRYIAYTAKILVPVSRSLAPFTYTAEGSHCQHSLSATVSLWGSQCSGALLPRFNSLSLSLSLWISTPDAFHFPQIM